MLENTQNKEVLLDVRQLSMHFPVGRKQVLKAVDQVSFRIFKGETFGLVGESGCGKTTVGRTIMRVYPRTGGEVIFKGMPAPLVMNRAETLSFSKRAQMIFQDPYSSLDPRMTIDDIINEGLEVHFPHLSRQEKHDRITRLLQRVGLNGDHAARFPHELSGGQRQRIGIARALAVEPEFIICDEPISALDVSIQAQIVNLLIKLQRESGLTYLFISHDLSMVKHISDRIAVMYLGSLVEVTDNEKLYEKPLHPYTQALISAIPIPNPDLRDTSGQKSLEGEVPSPINTPPGCKFSSRCPYCIEACRAAAPPLRQVEEGHYVACVLYNEGQELPAALRKRWKNSKDALR